MARGMTWSAAPISAALRMANDLRRRLLAPAGARRERLGRSPLPPPLRPQARLAVLDVTEFFGETTAGPALSLASVSRSSCVAAPTRRVARRRERAAGATLELQ